MNYREREEIIPPAPLDRIGVPLAVAAAAVAAAAFAAPRWIPSSARRSCRRARCG